MKISIICVGKIKENYLKLAIEEYSKRLSKYIKLKIVEVPDEKVPETLSKQEEDQAKLKEANKILKQVTGDDFLVALCIEAKQLDSLELAGFIQKSMTGGISHIVFVIGGSLGLHQIVLKRADFLLSFSKLTFPHQLMRVFLLEQLYRTQRILNGEPYHK